MKMLFNEINNSIAVWVSGDASGTDLAQIANDAITHNADILSVVPDSVSVIWPWIENKGIRLLSRFYLAKTGNGAMDAAVADLSERINNVFKLGADGAQVFMSVPDFPAFCRHISVVRDDLFFNKELCIGLDISDIDSWMWNDIFDNLNKVRASSLMLVLARDNGNKSDFVGRVNGMLENMNKCSWNGKLYYLLGDKYIRIEQVWRLAQAIRPAVCQNLRFFITEINA